MVLFTVLNQSVPKPLPRATRVPELPDMSACCFFFCFQGREAVANVGMAACIKLNKVKEVSIATDFASWSYCGHGSQ